MLDKEGAHIVVLNTDASFNEIEYKKGDFFEYQTRRIGPVVVMPLGMVDRAFLLQEEMKPVFDYHPPVNYEKNEAYTLLSDYTHTNGWEFKAGEIAIVQRKLKKGVWEYMLRNSKGHLVPLPLSWPYACQLLKKCQPPIYEKGMVFRLRQDMSIGGQIFRKNTFAWINSISKKGITVQFSDCGAGSVLMDFNQDVLIGYFTVHPLMDCRHTKGWQGKVRHLLVDGERYTDTQLFYKDELIGSALTNSVTDEIDDIKIAHHDWRALIARAMVICEPLDTVKSSNKVSDKDVEKMVLRYLGLPDVQFLTLEQSLVEQMQSRNTILGILRTA